MDGMISITLPGEVIWLVVGIGAWLAAVETGRLAILIRERRELTAQRALLAKQQIMDRMARELRREGDGAGWSDWEVIRPPTQPMSF